MKKPAKLTDIHVDALRLLCTADVLDHSQLTVKLGAKFTQRHANKLASLGLVTDAGRGTLYRLRITVAGRQRASQ